MDNKISIYTLTKSQLIQEISLSQSYRIKQLVDWLFKKNIASFDDISNIPKIDIQELKKNYYCNSLKISKVSMSAKDTTKKYLLETYDHQFIEAVAIPNEKGTYTLCLSSQIGCSFSCNFCATGKMKLTRNLHAHEIVEQYLIVNKETNYKVKNIVYMGMGEPLLNYNEVLKSIKILIDSDGFALSQRRISISTSGVIQGIKKLISDNVDLNLLISLHSADQRIRNLIMPNLVKDDLSQLKSAINEYSQKFKKRLTLEYIMLDGVNDRDQDLKILSSFVKGLNIKINLIAYNNNPGLDYRPTPSSRIAEFKDKLLSLDIETVQRYKKGDDIAAGCGQLASGQND